MVVASSVVALPRRGGTAVVALARRGGTAPRRKTQHTVQDSPHKQLFRP